MLTIHSIAENYWSRTAFREIISGRAVLLHFVKKDIISTFFDKITPFFERKGKNRERKYEIKLNILSGNDIMCLSYFKLSFQKGKEKEIFKMNIAICDDDRISQGILKNALSYYGRDRNIDVYSCCFSSGIDLIESKELFDVIFMDYEMTGLNGLKTSEIMRKNNDNTPIIFLSAHPTIVFDAFTVNAFRFLTKPLDVKKLYKALDDFRSSLRKDNVLIVKTLEKTWSIKHSDIIYAEAQRKHTLIRTVKTTLDVARCLGEIEEMLPEDCFIRVHKSYVVNFEHIVSYDKDYIFFGNGERAEQGSKYSSAFRTEYLNYVRRNNPEKSACI